MVAIVKTLPNANVPSNAPRQAALDFYDIIIPTPILKDGPLVNGQVNVK